MRAILLFGFFFWPHHPSDAEAEEIDYRFDLVSVKKALLAKEETLLSRAAIQMMVDYQLVQDLENILNTLPATDRDRLVQLLAQVNQSRADHLKKQVDLYGQEHRIDLLIEAIIRFREPMTDAESFCHVTLYARELLKESRTRLGVQEFFLRSTSLPLGSIAEHRAAFRNRLNLVLSPTKVLIPVNQPEAFDSAKCSFVMCPEFHSIAPLETHPRLIVSGGPVRNAHANPELGVSFSNGLIFANGNMNLGGVTNSVIVSDGDVVIDSKFIITKSLIIARGSVQANVSQVSVMAGGDYRNHGNRPIADAPNQFLLGGKFIPELVKPGANQYLKIEQKVKEPFGVFRFFETRELGVQTRLTESKTVEVHGVDPKRHFGKAGFQNGDLIEAINGRPVESPETFRQMVRRAIVDTQAEFAIKRRGERIKLQIKFPTDCLGSETR